MQLSPRSRWLTYGILTLLAALARWHTLGGDVYGDESWYVYLSRDWGSEAGLVLDNQDPIPHLMYRPVFYATYFLPAWAGLTAARWVTLLFGVMSVPLGMRLAERMGAPPLYAVIAGLCVALAPNLLRHNTIFFPDTMAEALLTASALAYFARRYVLAPFLMALTVLTKEACAAFAIVFCIMAFLRGDGLRRSMLYLAPLVYVAFVVVFTTQVMGARGQGWSHDPLTASFLRQLLVAPVFAPFIVALAVTKRWEALAVWLTGPLFYVAWAYGLGRGINVWYAVTPAAVASAAFAVGVFSLIDFLMSIDAIASRLRQHPKWTIAVTAIAVGLVVKPFWREARYVYRNLDASHLPSEIMDGAAFIQQYKPQHVHLINCFWALGFGILRPPGSTATRAYVSTYEEAVPGPDVTVWCSHDDRIGPPASFAGCELLRSPTFAIFKRDHCN